MKIVAIVCEFNPFHNGHRYLIERAKTLSACDAVLCIMSGSFTQRGELCILDKYDRARHAVLGGADAVVELPLPFAVAPADVFARGAIKILSSIPAVTTLAFGCESGTAEQFSAAAGLLINESREFRTALQAGLSRGESYIRSYAEAYRAVGGEDGLLSGPNNVLGIEYAKALLRAKANVALLPVRRKGSAYDDEELGENYSSAGAIRKNVSSPLVKNNVPDFVYCDLKDPTAAEEGFRLLMQCDLLRASAQDLARVYGCNEGLENRLISLAQAMPLEEIVRESTSKRYSAARIRRILCANSLNLYRDDCERYLDSELYVKPLAVKKERADDVLSAFSQSAYPTIGFKMKDKQLSPTAEECLQKEERGYFLWAALSRGGGRQEKSRDRMILV